MLAGWWWWVLDGCARCLNLTKQAALATKPAVMHSVQIVDWKAMVVAGVRRLINDISLAYVHNC